MKTSYSLWMLCLAIITSGCFLGQNPRVITPRFAERKCTSVPKNSGDYRIIYVADLGSRVGVIVRSDDVIEQLGWSIEEVFNHPWIEISWGSPVLFGELPTPLQREGVARLSPLESVILVTPVDAPPERVYARGDLVRLGLTGEGLGRVAALIEGSLAKSDVGASQRVGDPLPGKGVLYAAVGKPSSSRTNAAWAAQGIVAAGCPINSAKPNGNSLMAAIYSLAPNAQTVIPAN